MTRRIGPAFWAATMLQTGAGGQVLFTVQPGGPSGLDPSVVYGSTASPFRALAQTGRFGGAASGFAPGDVVDGFSQRQALPVFHLCFSVDPFSTGAPPPLIGFPHPGHTFNVTDQASRNQAVGDAFISTDAFSIPDGLVPSPVPSGAAGTGALNNVLAINQSPGFRFNFNLVPNLGPARVNPVASTQDDVNGGGGAAPRLFFTLAAVNPLTGAANSRGLGGADILFDPTASLAGGVPFDENVYATATDLGLAPADEINAISVFDTNDDGVWNPGDAVLFSLDRGSPSLPALGADAADILIAVFGEPARLFADNAEFGLADTDNVDMLELVPFAGSTLETIRRKVEVRTLARQDFEAFEPQDQPVFFALATAETVPAFGELALPNVDDNGTPVTLGSEDPSAGLPFAGSWINSRRSFEGLADGDFLGVTDFDGFPDGDALPFRSTVDGRNWFRVSDPDGTLVLRFPPVPVPGCPDPAVEVAIFVAETAYERGDALQVVAFTDAGAVNVVALFGDPAAPLELSLNQFAEEHRGNFVEIVTPLPPGTGLVELVAFLDTDEEQETLGVDTVRISARPVIVSPCNAADAAEPFGVLDIFDIIAYFGRFTAGDPAADLAAPFGVLDVFDLLRFFELFAEGCSG